MVVLVRPFIASVAMKSAEASIATGHTEWSEPLYFLSYSGQSRYEKISLYTCSIHRLWIEHVYGVDRDPHFSGRTAKIRACLIG